MGKYTHQQYLRSRLKRRYGVTVYQYNEMFKAQGGVCAICKRPPQKKALAVDHNHETGEVRGLLCGRCNGGLGWYEKNRKAIRRYLAR